MIEQSFLEEGGFVEDFELDNYSLRILRALQANGRRALQDIAADIGLSTTPCWRRLKALEERGYIRRYTALLDRERLGLKLCVFAHVTLQRATRNAVKEFEAAMLACREVVECYSATGDADYVIKVLVRDTKRYDEFLKERIFCLPAVAHIRSSITLHEVKNDSAVPV